MLYRSFYVALALVLTLPGGLATGTSPRTIDVQVGPNNQQVFQPQQVNANNGDHIRFIL